MLSSTAASVICAVDGTGVETFITGTYNTNIALDTTNDKIYWANGAYDSIHRANLDGSGVETILSWKVPNHKQRALKNLHRFKLPKTEQISREVISLPMYPELTDSQIKYVIKTIRAFYENK